MRQPLFFVSEKSYIDGSDINGVIYIDDEKIKHCNDIYDLNGQPVDDSYRGIVIKEGKKIIQ